jgi:hypothetical protein
MTTADITNIVSAFATCLTAGLTGMYVHYTMKTFKEIKKQTDYQIRAYLFASKKISQDKCETDSLLLIREKYDESVSKLIPDQSKDETSLFIELSNRGKTDICWWKITLKISIHVGEYLKSVHLADTVREITIQSTEANQIIQPQSSITVPIGLMGYMPEAVFSWCIEYKDLHNNEYKEFSGDKEYTHLNKLLYNYKNPVKK